MRWKHIKTRSVIKKGEERSSCEEKMTRRKKEMNLDVNATMSFLRLNIILDTPTIDNRGPQSSTIERRIAISMGV